MKSMEKSVNANSPYPLRTFNPIGEKDKIMLKLDEVAAELEDDMKSSGWAGRTVTLKFKLDTYQGAFRTPFKL